MLHGMSRPYEIRPITTGQTYPLRQAVLRAGFPPSESVFAGDDDPDTLHLGALLDGRIVGIASVYREAMPGNGQDDGCAWRLRGMAVEERVRNQRIGSALLAACMDHVRRQGGRLFWCNARTPAVGFYRAHGLAAIGDEFDIPTAGPHYRMRIELAASVV